MDRKRAPQASVRRSRQCHFYGEGSAANAVGSVAVRDAFIDAVAGLRRELQGSRTISLPYLEPFETELSFLLYPVGGHYKRHLDIPRSKDAGWKLKGRSSEDGGSFTGARTRRVISFILYLNKQWDVADGGELRVYNAYPPADGPPRGPHHAAAVGTHASDASSEHGSTPPDFAADVTPEGGTLVLMMSGDVEHMVRETRAERQCIVGWFNEYREERVADMDTLGTRTVLGR